jgi:hypothetical protein
MVTLEQTLVNALWVLGVAGLLAAGSYLSWLRRLRQWSWRATLSIPAAQAAIFLSLTFVCAGATLNTLAFDHAAAWWQPLVWGGLSFLYLSLAIVHIRAGARQGWQTPTDGESRR